MLMNKWVLGFLFFSLFSSEKSLINPEYIRNYLTHEAPWADSHGAEGDFLGAGMLYYALVYNKKAKLCVCLGSGGGFVPRIMKQAQRDLHLKDARTILIDANIGDYGRPAWLAETHFFKTEFPDIEILLEKTETVAKSHPEWKIDYLHIDADHSFRGVYLDFHNFLPLMNRKSIISIHDTKEFVLPCAEIIPYLRRQGYNILNFSDFGNGTAIIYLP